jgi:hypothetical protein
MRVMTAKYSALFFSILILTACGGGSGSTPATTTPAPIPAPNPQPAPTSEPPAPVVITGVFVDSAVQGLNYQTATQSGKTDENGTFSYVDGETVVFSIGDIAFPAVMAKAMLSPLDVFEVTDVNDIRVQNMARLLQTLDHDGSSGNGITITDDAHNQAVGVAVDFASVDFAAQVMDVVASSGAAYTSLISIKAAVDHLNIALGNITNTRSCDSETSKAGYVGDFSNLAHGVSGSAKVIDNCTIEITMFNFDGQAPNVQFYAGNNVTFTGSEAFAIGGRIDGTRYVNQTVVLRIPNGKTVEDFDSLSVWCVEFGADFGNLRFTAP